MSIGESTLGHLLRVNLEGPPVDASGAVQLWWRKKTRRVNRKEHLSTSAAPELQCNEPEPEPEPEPFEFDWEEWEEWINQK